MMDLFAWAESYPRAAGWKEQTTSRDAAIAIKSEAEQIRAAALTAIRNAGTGGLTAHETAAKLARDRMIVSPRLSELRAAGKIRPGDYRRENQSGKEAIAWVAA